MHLSIELKGKAMKTHHFIRQANQHFQKNFYNIKVIGFVAFVLLNLISYAFTLEIAPTYKISGKVVNGHNGTPIEFARVVLKQESSTVMGINTDEEGVFNLDAQPGVCQLSIQAIGFDNLNREVLIKDVDIDLGLLKLNESGEELEEIEISKDRVMLKKVSFGGLDSRSMESDAPLPKRGATGAIATTGGVSAIEGKDPVIRGGRSDMVVTYIDGKEVKAAHKSKTVLLESDDAAIEEIAIEEASEPGVETYEGGVLTAGELNDFNKFNAWKHLTENDLSVFGSVWKMRAQKRYSVVLKNNEDGAVIDAEVVLRDRKGGVVWAARTDNVGRAELWSDVFDEKKGQAAHSIQITYGGYSFEAQDLVSSEDGVNYLKLPVGCFQPSFVDVAFVVDATGSMGDEINYLKAELRDVVGDVKSTHKELEFNTASIFYKDHTDDFVTVASDFTENLDITMSFIQDQRHGGGGDMPEAVDSALSEAINGLHWSEEARARILFLVLDAPPHEDEASVKRIQESIAQAASKGVRIVPIICSGANKSNEYLMRTAALNTNGTYLFLTDHSGVGGSHLAPSTDEYEVTYLNDLMKDVINRFVQGVSCQNTPYLVDGDSPRLVDWVKVDPSLKKSENPNTPVIIEVSNQVLAASGKVNGVSDEAMGHFNRPEGDDALQSHLSLYPNPATDQLNVRLSAPQERVVLLDISGKVLREYNPGDVKAFSIAINEYPGGPYLLGFIKGEQLKTKRFVIKK